MGVQEIQTAITQLAPDELGDLLEWMELLESEAWDRQIERDAKAGRFAALRQRVREQRGQALSRRCI